jgi:hypothetical protein
LRPGTRRQAVATARVALSPVSVDNGGVVALIGHARTTSGRPKAASLVVGALAAAGAVLLTGCGGSNYRYVKSSANHTYFKVPKDWKIYDKGQIVEASGSRLSESQSSTLRFMVAFDADPKPSLEHDLQSATRPFGLARVRQLNADERETFNLLALRNEVVPIDQIVQQNAGDVELLQEPREITTTKGLAGTRLVYRVISPDGSFTVDQTGLVDAKTQTVYFFIIGCESNCYDHNKRTISEIADSWTVKER